MNNKVFIEIIVPDIEKSYEMYIPVNRKIGNIIVLINKAINEFTSGLYQGSSKSALYNRESKTKYNPDIIVKDTDIRNGSILILM